MPIRFPWQRPLRDAPAYVELRTGIVGAGGTRFKTTERMLRDYAGPVLDLVGLDVLVRQAEVWVQSRTAVGVLSLAGSLFFLPWWAALLVAAVAFAAWTAVSPGLATPRGAGLFRAAEAPIVQAIALVLVLSYVASIGAFGSVWAGLLGFVLFRLGIVGLLLDPALKRVLASMYPLGAADQTLRSLILRWAIRHGVSLPGMSEMEARARDFWRHRSRKGR